MFKNTLLPTAGRIRLTAWLSRLQLIALIALIGYWTLVQSPPKQANPWIIATVLTFPLLVFVPSVIVGHARGHAWLCFVVLLYFIAAVMNATTPGKELLGLLESLLTLGLFTSAMLFARWKSQLARAGR